MSVRADTERTKPLRADAERNRRRIIDAARELFASRGIDITLDDVAAHAKVGVGTVYRRFSCKEELIDGVFEQRLEDVLFNAKAALEFDDAWDGLVTFLEQMCAGISADRGLGEVVLGSDEGCNGIATMRERIDPYIEKIVVRARESGQLRPDVEVNDFFPLIGMVGAAAEFSCAVDSSNWKRYFTVVIDGLRARPGTPSDLPGRAFTTDEIVAAKAAMHRRRR
ncbi:TetR/AcrR family transcriptional regulator [Rhodococcus sp. G-MC3]|uniref:TetR/AcrR family transcriptional regulator n=1 Tax=Rhodococcus sp. G-MC3 TaxID=3046209 RepID=UPI0024BBA6BF|nr:TetR/AcrR family transcriptional regulator [Rhodococcus sp. G-MC3]MDJ0395359.1 TetR/AcrR family transcriptional regulator [Rhodococcus sp. G-MC3]